MSDPIFLRNLINNTVYAEQLNSAQKMAHEAAREKNIRVQQQKVKDESLAVGKLDESAGLQVGEEGNNDQLDRDEQDSEEEESEKKTDLEKQEGGVQRIDITV